MENQRNYKNLRNDSDEEEIYLLKIPKGIDLNVLLHAKIELTKKSEVKSQSEVFYLKPIYDESGPKYFQGSDDSEKIRPLSILQLTKSVPDNMKIDQSHPQQFEEENNKKPLSVNGIKDDYKAVIELQKDIKQKIDQARQRYCKEKPKGKQVLSHKKSLLISQLLETTCKIINSTNVENTKEIKESNEKTMNDNQKLKRKNYKSNSFQELNIIDRSHLKDSAIVASPIALEKGPVIEKELQLDADISEFISKKIQNNKSEISLNIENTKELNSYDITSENLKMEIDNVVPKMKKKRKAKNSLQELQLDIDLSESISKKIQNTKSEQNTCDTSEYNKKKKKKHNKSEKSISKENTEELSENLKLEIDNVVPKAKNNKKHKAKNSFQELQSDGRVSVCILKKTQNSKNENLLNIENTKELNSFNLAEENLKIEIDNVVPNVKKERKAENSFQELQLDAESSKYISNKKKRKKNHSKSEVSINIGHTKVLGSSDTASTSNTTIDNVMHKKRKKNKIIIHSIEYL